MQTSSKSDHMLMWAKYSLLILFCISLTTPTSVESAKQCPLGLLNGICDSSAVCAIFNGKSSTCVGWAKYRCTSAQYRDMQTCSCVNCPKGSGVSCTESDECCSLEDCNAIPTTTPKPKPMALSSASPCVPQAVTAIFLVGSLSWMHLCVYT
jgi:hypothetical protein